jgi:hypothetical protein
VCHTHDTPAVIMHRDALAADYREAEYHLIGMPTKFAGICGTEVRIFGTNRQTVDVCRRHRRAIWRES